MVLKWVAAPVLVVMVFAAACSSGDAGITSSRLAVAEDSGILKLVDPDTGEIERIPGGGNARREYPVWSPDGSRLAWTQVTSGGLFSLDVYDGEQVDSIATNFFSFYNFWDPSSDRIGYLGSAGGGVGFGVADVEAVAASVVDADRPYYFSWADDGQRLVVHSSNSVRILDRTGEVELTLSASLSFQAPVWLPGGEMVLISVGETADSRVVSFDLETGVEREYFSTSGLVSFVVDAAGERVAFTHRSIDPGVVAVTPEGEVVPTGLFIMELDSGEITPIDDDPQRLSPYWSPDGKSLLSITVDPDSPTQFARWEVHDLDARLTAQTERMTPSIFTAEQLPFADQYAQSSTPWAPDSSTFLFSGTIEGGEPGVYLHDSDAFEDSELLTDGVYAVWSPG